MPLILMAATILMIWMMTVTVLVVVEIICGENCGPTKTQMVT